MNARQIAFYRQARSDWAVFCHFYPLELGWRSRFRAFWCGLVGVRPYSFPPCHPLHYLQMCTEKLAKAYYQLTPPRMGHNAFRRFLADLLLSPTKAAASLGFADLAGLTRWGGSAVALVGAIEDLAPQIAESKGLPNPEYPWPRGVEVHAPLDHSFSPEIFSLLATQAKSGEPPFFVVLSRMLGTMQRDGWHL